MNHRYPYLNISDPCNMLKGLNLIQSLVKVQIAPVHFELKHVNNLSVSLIINALGDGKQTLFLPHPELNTPVLKFIDPHLPHLRVNLTTPKGFQQS